MRSMQEASTARASAIRRRLSSAEVGLVRSAVQELRHRTVPCGEPARRSVAERLGRVVIRKVLEVVGSARPAFRPDQRVPPVSHPVAMAAVDGIEPRVVRSRADRVGCFGVPVRVTPQIKGEVHGVRDGALRPRRAGGEGEERHGRAVTELPPRFRTRAAQASSNSPGPKAAPA